MVEMMIEMMDDATLATSAAATDALKRSLRTPPVAKDGEPSLARTIGSSGMPVDDEASIRIPISAQVESSHHDHDDFDDANSSCCSKCSHAPTEVTNHTLEATTTTTVSADATRNEPKAAAIACTPSQQQHNKCRVCARLGYRQRYAMNSLVFHSMEVFDIDIGLFELVRRIDDDHNYCVDREVAIRTADMALNHVKQFRNKLMQVGLLQQQGQNFVGESSHARVMAPFEKSEFRIGRLLGTGGFSSVYEVESFDPDPVLSAGVTGQELAARQFMADHASRLPETNSQRTSHMYREKTQHNVPIARYAIKHLKHTLTSHPERFQRAALDLVLEGQLLLALDHPGIISVRGWSYHGPNAYRTGKHSDYFLILDRLPESLDSRILEWRRQYCRYRRRLLWHRAKYTAKFDRLFQERMQVALDIASALAYLHDRRIINRDVKTANIGFDVHGHVKMFDFGLSRLLPDEEEAVGDGNYSMSRVGTKLYMAPEVRHKQPYTLSADVYSFGIVLWEILALSTPKKPCEYKAMVKSIDRNGCWLPVCPCWPTDVQELIRSCLCHDPAQRPSMVQVCGTLHKLSAAAAGRRPCPRRRSTFRIDMSKVAKDQESSNMNAAAREHGSGESKTSRTSASDDCLQ